MFEPRKKQKKGATHKVHRDAHRSPSSHLAPLLIAALTDELGEASREGSCGGGTDGCTYFLGTKRHSCPKDRSVNRDVFTLGEAGYLGHLTAKRHEPEETTLVAAHWDS